MAITLIRANERQRKMSDERRTTQQRKKQRTIETANRPTEPTNNPSTNE